MIETATYYLMQLMGYRKVYYDWAFQRNIPLESYQAWQWRPRWTKGTYRETGNGWRYAGYGLDA